MKSTNNKNKKEDDKQGNKTRLDNRQTMVSSAIRELVGRPEKRDGIYKTIEASYLAGHRSTIREIEEREELESRGINPDFDRVVFRNDLKKQAILNDVWLEKSYLDDKKLRHDHAKAATSENDIYENPDGKTLTKVNNLSHVKGTEHKINLLAFIDRLAAHNVLFPNVAYDIKGFMDNKQGFTSMVMEQPYVNVSRNATQEEIDKYLFNRGFRLEGKTLKYWTNDVYIIEDARPANVLKGKDGNLYFIDTIPHSVEYFKMNAR